MNYIKMLDEWSKDKKELLDYAVEEQKQASEILKGKVDELKFLPHMIESLIHTMVTSDNTESMEELKTMFKQEYVQRMHYEQYVTQLRSDTGYQETQMKGGVLFKKK